MNPIERIALSKIDDTHYLCAHRGDGAEGWAVVLILYSDYAVELISFEAIAGYKEVMLGWQTEVEIDNKKWLIARSTKEIEPEIIAKIPVKGVGERYIYTDLLVEEGIAYLLDNDTLYDNVLFFF